MKEFDMRFFFNLKVVAATATISINHVRVRGVSASTELIYHMPVARGGFQFSGFQSSASHKHTYTHKFSKKKCLKRSIINVFPCEVFCFKFSFKTSESLKLLIYPLNGRKDAMVLCQVTDTLKARSCIKCNSDIKGSRLEVFWSLFFNKVLGAKPLKFLEKRLRHRYFL